MFYRSRILTYIYIYIHLSYSGDHCRPFGCCLRHPNQASSWCPGHSSAHHLFQRRSLTQWKLQFQVDFKFTNVVILHFSINWLSADRHAVFNWIFLICTSGLCVNIIIYICTATWLETESMCKNPESWVQLKIQPIRPFRWAEATHSSAKMVSPTPSLGPLTRTDSKLKLLIWPCPSSPPPHP